MSQRKLHAFLVFLIFSLVGNACADFALIWYCVAKFSDANSSLLTSFYTGQAFGVIALAPFLAYFVDRVPRRIGGIALDLTYASILATLIALHHFDWIGTWTLFPFAVVTAALGSLHKGGIGYAALKVLSQELGVTSIVAKYHAALFFSNLVGASVSGVLFSQVGLSGAMALAIVTFLPMPFIYMKLFAKNVEAEKPAKPFRPRALVHGWAVIFRNKILFWATICVTVVNMASNIFPGLVALSFEKVFPGETVQASTAVSLAILVGVLSYGPASRYARGLKLRAVPLIALSASLATLVGAAFYPHPVMVAIAFAAQCAGAALLNTMTGSLRVSQIPQAEIAQVNSSFLSLVYMGQVIGSLVLIPTMQKSDVAGVWSIFAAFVVAALIGLVFLPAKNLNQIEAAS